MADQAEQSGWGKWLQRLGSVTSILTAVGGGFIFFVSTPADAQNWYQTKLLRHGVSLAIPEDGAGLANGKLEMCGTADLKSEWVLVVFTQSPAELKYYVSSPGAVSVRKDERWRVSTTFGDADKDPQKVDPNQSYKVIVLALDEIGQRELQPTLAKGDGERWTSALPHWAARTQVDVHAVANSEDFAAKCDLFMKALP